MNHLDTKLKIFTEVDTKKIVEYFQSIAKSDKVHIRRRTWCTDNNDVIVKYYHIINELFIK